MNIELFINTNNYDITKPVQPTPQEYLDKMVSLFEQYALKSEEATSSQWEKLQEIIDNKNMIEKKLQPLNALGGYSLDIVGGSLRDIMLGKPETINDYDIVITPNFSGKEKVILLAQELNIKISDSENEIELTNIKMFRIAAAKEQIEVKGYPWDSTVEKDLTDRIEKDFLFSKIVQHLMKDTPDYKHYGANNVREKYMNFHIMSINQFSGVNNIKVDLIVSEREYSGHMFLSTFDFELCKIKADLTNITTKEELLNNIVPLGSMLRDVENNTLSVNVIKFPKENLEYFFNKHLVKLMEKYPNHKVNLYSTKKVEYFTDEEKERWIFAHKLKIEIAIPEKGFVTKKMKI